MQRKEFQYKVVLLGESSVGKSSIALRFARDQFNEFQESTIGAAFLTKTLGYYDTASKRDISVKFEIWDTAGQERYHSLAPMYYRGAQASIVVYDVTNEDSFGRAKNWVQELRKQASPRIVIALVGNKSDLEEKRTVKKEDVDKYAEENSLISMDVSAKTGDQVEELFLIIGKHIVIITVLPNNDLPLCSDGSNFYSKEASQERETYGPSTGCKVC